MQLKQFYNILLKLVAKKVLLLLVIYLTVDGALTKSASRLFHTGMLRGKKEYCLTWLQVVGIVWYLYEGPLRSLLGSTRRVGGTATSLCDTLYIRHMCCWYLLVSRGYHLNCCRRAEGLTLGSLHDLLNTTLAARRLTFSRQYLSLWRYGSHMLEQYSIPERVREQ